jgi:serine/threonine-protein kinase HipA
VPEVASAADGLDFAETAERLRTDANRVAIAGAQPKLSAAMVTLPTADRHGILKLEPPEYPNLALNEAATMSRARRAGIVTASARVVQDKAGRNGLHVRRFDRIVRRGQVVGRIHVEDGCQLCDLYPADKYRIGLRELAEAVTEFSSSPRREVLGLLRTVAFSYLVGNADLHAKNFSVWVRPGTRIVELSPAYDLVCTLVFSHLDTRMALRMLGKDDKLSLRDFVEFGSRFQVPERAVGQAVGEVLAATTDWDDELPGFAPTEADVRRAASVLRDRRRRLGA